MVCIEQKPNKQNEMYWAPVDPMIEVQCKVQGGKKVMCWCGVLDGKLIIHRFDKETSVNEITIWNCFKLLSGQKSSTKLLPTKQCYFQQDGAPPH